MNNPLSNNLPSTVECFHCQKEFDTDGRKVEIFEIKKESSGVLEGFVKILAIITGEWKWYTVVCPHCGHVVAVKPV